MKRKTLLVIIGFAVIAIALFVGLSHIKGSLKPTAYEVLVQHEYSGTEEQLIASLIGELSAAEGETETAFERAKLLGYNGSYSDWIDVLAETKAADEEKAVYKIACDSGYAGGLEKWLEKLVPSPKQLGEQVAEYQLACENGFEGSFIRWIMSLVGYQED